MTNPAREAWQRFELIHGLTYFTPELPGAGRRLGLKGYWMAYFAFRVAPLGALGPAAATAVCYNFAPRRVARALPEAWALTTPEQALAARLDAACSALRRVLAGRVTDDEVARAADLAWSAAQADRIEGRPLGAANHALPRPEDAYERLWQATTTLRELRGDGHNAVLVAYGVGPVEAHLIKAAAGESDAETLKVGRQWADDEWEDARHSLLDRGVLTADGALTAAGRDLHATLEQATDEAASGPWLGGDRAAECLAALDAIAHAVAASGIMPSPSPVGLGRYER